MLVWNLLLLLFCIALGCAARSTLKRHSSVRVAPGSAQAILRFACEPGRDTRHPECGSHAIHRLAGRMLRTVTFDKTRSKMDVGSWGAMVHVASFRGTRSASVIAVRLQRACMASAYSAARCRCPGYSIQGSIESG